MAGNDHCLSNGSAPPMTASRPASGFNFNPQDFNADPIEAAYRNSLGNGLESVLGAGAETLADLVKGLNELSVAGPGGRAWTEDLLASELRRLAW